jgi:hypothetical protein
LNNGQRRGDALRHFVPLFDVQYRHSATVIELNDGQLFRMPYVDQSLKEGPAAGTAVALFIAAALGPRVFWSPTFSGVIGT